MEAYETEQLNEDYKLKIMHDRYPINPFEDWDCNPSLWARSNGFGKDYSDGNISDFIISSITDNQIIRHQKYLIDDIIGMKGHYYNVNSFNRDYPRGEYTNQERIDVIRDMLIENDNDWDMLAKLCDKFKIPYYRGTSRGYNQGDWADVFITITDKDVKRCGFNRKNYDKIMEGAFDLFSHWAWGDVYQYQLLYQGELIDSCGGFYGDNWEENGLYEHAKGFMEWHQKDTRKKREKKIKALIKNNVPYYHRINILMNY